MRKKCIKWLDLVILGCLYLVIFCISFTKAGQEIFTWMAISLWMIKKLLSYGTKETRNFLPQAQLMSAIFIFIIVNALSTITSSVFHLSLRAFFAKISKFVFIFFIVIETINNRKRLRNFLIVMIISATLMVADATVQYFRGTDFLRGFPYERLRASFSSSNGFAGWLIVFIPILLCMLISKQFKGKIKKVALAVLLMLLLICLSLTISRGAWLGFASGLGFICYWVARFSSRRRRKVFYLLMIVCLFLVSFILPGTIKKRIKSIGSIDSSALERMSLWKEALSILEDFPVLGSGLNTYSVVARNYKSIEGGGIYPHNSFLQMAAETGIIGLFSFGWVIISLFKLGSFALKKQRDPLVLGLLAGILGFLIQSFFDTTLYSLPLVVLFWLMMGLTVAVIRLNAETNS